MQNKKRVLIQKPDKIVGTIFLPGSKSETNRLIVLGVLCLEPFTIQNFSNCEDSQVFIEFMDQFSIEYTIHQATRELVIIGSIHDCSHEKRTIQCHDAGTAFRFLTTLAMFINGTTIIEGSNRLAERPILQLVAGLQEAGVPIHFLDQNSGLPLEISGDIEFMPDNFKINAQDSSQYLSALLLMAPMLPIGFRIYVKGGNTASVTYIKLTLNLLQELGIIWLNKSGNCYELTANNFRIHKYEVESDWSAASYWLGMASIIPCKLSLKKFHSESLQGDIEQLKIFKKWGLTYYFDQHTLQIQNELGNIVEAINYDFQNMPDLAQTFAVLSCFANKTSILSGLQTLPFKETNRIEALISELSNLGLQVQSTQASLKLEPGIMPNHVIIETYNDHRMAMSFSLLAAIVDVVEILAPEVVAKSYPDFWKDLQSVGFTLQFFKTP